jgi:hypothetical protein
VPTFSGLVFEKVGCFFASLSFLYPAANARLTNSRRLTLPHSTFAPRCFNDLLRQFPELHAAVYSAWALLNDNQWISKVKIPGRTDSGQTYQLGVSPGFLDTMGIRLLEGRDFARRDLGPKSRVSTTANTSPSGTLVGLLAYPLQRIPE